MEFYKLPVSKVINDTPESVLVRFSFADGLREKYAFTAGQYLTLEKEVDGNLLRRCYSLCSAPYEDELTIAVKAVEGGVFTEILMDESLEGSEMSVGTPEGRFIVEPQENAQRNHYFIAAGSGITPIMSMIKTVLEKEPKSNVFLLYGNKRPESVMLKEQLEALSERYENQFHLNQYFSKSGGSSWLKRAMGSAEHGKGRISLKVIDKWLKLNPTHNFPSHYYVCGPGELIESTIEFLSGIGIPSENIHREYFTISKHKNGEDNVKPSAEEGDFAPTDRAHVTVNLDGEKIEFELGQEMTILEAVEMEGCDPPFSCRSGTCTTCMAKLKKGKVEMDFDFGLMPDEKEEGYILTCQSRVASKDIEIDYDF